MPFPIEPVGRPRRDALVDWGQIGQLLDCAPRSELGVSASWDKEASASDEEAQLLLQLWENSQPSEAPSQDAVYRVPAGFRPDDLLRLKTRGFIVGDTRQVKFMPKASRIIRTMVLGEQNNFDRHSVRKPYSVILAEAKAPKRKSNLALASLREVRAWSRKEYNVRVYRNPNGGFDVWCFRGPIGKTMTAEPKGHFQDKDQAWSEAERIIRSKMNRNYPSIRNRRDDKMLHPQSDSVYIYNARLTYEGETVPKTNYRMTEPLNAGLPGVPASSLAPEPPRRPPSPPKRMSAPAEQPVDEEPGEVSIPPTITVPTDERPSVRSEEELRKLRDAAFESKW